MASKSKVRYAVVGAGHIAQVAVLPAFKHAQENSELVAIVSGDSTKRMELKHKYDLEYVADYPDLELMLKTAQIDALYLATPNATHLEFVLRAAKVGVHVLCEKPLAPSVADVQVMVDACKYGQVKLMVAYRLHFEEAMLSAFDLVATGRVGAPRIFESTFSHVVRSGDIRLSAEAGGGAALDLGVYCVNAARHIFQAEPVLVFATSIMRNGSDETTTATLRFAADRVAHFTVSNAAASVSSFRVVGTDGDLLAEPAYEYAEAREHYLTLGGGTEHKTYSKRDQFAPELIHFSDCILNNREPQPSAEEAIADLRVIEAIAKSAAMGQAVVLEPRTYAYHPRAEQQMHLPAVSRQITVNAPSPSLR